MLQWIRNRYWSDCYLFFSTKSQQFLRMFGPFSQSSPFLVSFYTLDFYFPKLFNYGACIYYYV